MLKQSTLEIVKAINPKLETHIMDIDALTEDAHEFMDSVINKVHRAVVIYGQSGMGKTHVVTNSLIEHGLSEGEDFVILRSHTTPLMLYVWLYLMRDENKFVVLDDCDGILANETGLNLLKAATDNSFRQIGWNTTTELFNPITHDRIPSSFEFNGRVIITTNIRPVTGKSRTANHMDAIRSRTTAFKFNLNTKEEQLAQIFYMVLEKDYLASAEESAILETEKLELLEFLQTNLDKARRLDLRLPQTIAREIKSKKNNWERRSLRLLEAA
jgi:hypothetical protein